MSTKYQGNSNTKNLYARSCAEPPTGPKLAETLALYYSHLTDEKTEAPGREAICLWPNDLSQNLNPGLSELEETHSLGPVCHGGYLDTLLGSPSSLD